MKTVNIGEAKTNLSKLVAQVEAGEEIELARGGQPVVRLVRVAPESPGSRILTRWGSGKLAGQDLTGDGFEFSEDELDAMYDELDQDVNDLRGP